MGQRDVGDAGIEHLHERGQRHRDGNDPRIDCRLPFGGLVHGDRSGTHYLIQTFGTTDIPGRSSCSFISPLSNTIFTGIRCTTFTYLPRASSSGSRLNVAPLAPAVEATWSFSVS